MRRFVSCQLACKIDRPYRRILGCYRIAVATGDPALSNIASELPPTWRCVVAKREGPGNCRKSRRPPPLMQFAEPVERVGACEGNAVIFDDETTAVRLNVE